MRPPVALPLVAIVLALAGVHARGAEALPSSDPSRPVTTARVGGSEADRAFRAAQQDSAARYREARAACNGKPIGERVGAARAELRRVRLEAKAAHDAAQKKAR